MFFMHLGLILYNKDCCKIWNRLLRFGVIDAPPCALFVHLDCRLGAFTPH